MRADSLARAVLLAGAIAVASACAPPAHEPPAPAASPVATVARPAAVDPGGVADAGAPYAFAPLRDRVLDDLLADDPSTARDLGLHAYDGKVAPVSRAALDARVARLNETVAALAAVPLGTLSPDDALDLAELKSWVDSSLFSLVDLDASRKSPQFYEALFGVSAYIDREYAPLEERAAQLTAHEEAALAEVAHVRENLSPPLSKPVTEVAARNFAGYATYLRGDVARLLARVGDDAQRQRFARANEALAAAATDLAAWLKKEAARGDQSHVLGPARFAKLLRVQEGLTMSLDDFERMNAVNLADNQRAYDALAGKAKESPVKEAQLFATATKMMQGARAFVVDHAIVTLASTDAATVRETPAYERWNSASIEMSGPFETARSAFYQLTIPDRTMPASERAAYLGSTGDLLGTTVHEVYPGHFVQGRWAERAPTRVQKAFGSYSFIEGWAHYVEEMMIDEGFGAEDPANRLAMLHGALLRNCRFAASVGMHTRGLTVDEAAHLFMTQCHQDTATAHEQAVRGTFDPGYFAYTLGKLEIRELRDEARARLGAAFSLQRFHDALLSHGAPPIALIHDEVLRELGK